MQIRPLYFSTLLSFFVCCFFLSTAKAESLLVAGDDNFPPFSYIDSEGQLSGIDVDMVRELGNRLNVNFEIQLMPWKRLLLLTQKGAVFGAFSLFRNEERETFAHFTGPIHYSTYVLVTSRDAPIEFAKISDLAGRKIGIEAGFSMGREFDQAAQSGLFQLVELFKYEDIFYRLLNRGIDGFVGNNLVLNYEMSLNHSGIKEHFFRAQKPVVVARPAYFVLSKNYPSQSIETWSPKITAELKKIEESGLMQKMIESNVSKARQ